MTKSDAIIKLSAVNRIYEVGGEALHALRAVELSIDGGEYLSIMGPSGSGKSTLLNVIGLLDRPTSGMYQLDGIETTALNDEQQARFRREKIGFVFQFFHLVPRLTAAENIELPMVLAGVPPGVRKERLAEILASFGLADRAGHRPDQLSGGQRQRAAIARATALRPPVLLADEPTGNLDRAAGREIVEVLEGLGRDGITLLIVTHDPEIGRRARRQVRIDDGRIVQDSVEAARS